MTIGNFDDSNVTWHELEGIDNLKYHICHVDEGAKIVDILFKMAANSKIILHRHHAAYKTLILQGELKIYGADGTLLETRPVGSYISTEVSGIPHSEGGGEQEMIGFFSNRGTDGVIYEILDPDLNTVATLGLADFMGLWQAQEKAAYELESA